MKTGGYFPVWLRIALWLLCWAAAGLLKFGYHELWKDEWQAWLMARDMGWGELLASLYYEGHPALWYLYLKVWTGTGLNDALAIQASHFLVLGLAGGVFWYFTRLPWWLSALLWLGYFPFFEYGVVNRGYVWIILLGFLLAGLLEKPERKGWLLALGIFLLCQTEVYGVLLGGALLVYSFWSHGKWAAFRQQWFRLMAGGWALGILVFLISVFPRASQDELAQAYVSDPLSWETVTRSFQGNWVNAYWIGAVPDTNVFGVQAAGLALSALLIAMMAWLFRKAKGVAWAFWAYQLVFFLFCVLLYTGGVRHWGMIVVGWMIFLQLWAYQRPVWGWAEWLIIGSVLVFQLRYTVMAASREVKMPFSNAEMTAAFINEKIPEVAPLVAINKFEAAPVVGYSGRTFYALPDGEPFTYFKWVEKVYLPPEEELKLFAAYKKVNLVVVMSPQPLDPKRYPDAELVKAFDEPSMKRENFYLYTVEQ